MSDPQSARAVADREAADWHARLGQRPVSAATLDEFARWRSESGNAEAYRRIEVLWRASGSLSADPDIQRLTRDTLKATDSRARPGWRRRVVPLAAVLVPSLAVAVALCAFWLPSRGVYSTDVGGQQIVRLDDGSRVQLDTETRVKVRYGPSERRILLEKGQALFTVTHDPRRPFRVEAGQAEVTALGTVFDVRREASGVRVTLVEGAVAVTDGDRDEARAWRLAAGQQVVTSRPERAPVVLDVGVATSWSEGRLVFRSTPLRDAVAEVNRYLPDKIVLAAGPIGDVQVNGVFASGDRDAFISAVSDLFGLRAEPLADGGTRLTSPSAGG